MGDVESIRSVPRQAHILFEWELVSHLRLNKNELGEIHKTELNKDHLGFFFCFNQHPILFSHVRI